MKAIKIQSLHSFMNRVASHFLVKRKSFTINSRDTLDQAIINCDGASQIEYEPQSHVEIPGCMHEDLRLREGIDSIERIEVLAPQTRYFSIINEENQRKIAYTVSGDMNGENLLLCLPGLLETKDTFTELHAYFLKFRNCKVISMDLSGRGQSDRLDAASAYRMSLYLSDIGQFIDEIILEDKSKPIKITVLGTSMGGVLAMYLTQHFRKNIVEIILNDIALTVNWTALYALYKSMKSALGYRELRQLAHELQVDERVISDVQLPGHFDLSYRADIWGMNFHEALGDFKGRIALIYGDKSEICTQRRVDDMKKFIPNLSVLKVGDAGHPAPFNLLVCEFIQSEMGM